MKNNNNRVERNKWDLMTRVELNLWRWCYEKDNNTSELLIFVRIDDRMSHHSLDLLFVKILTINLIIFIFF